VKTEITNRLFGFTLESLFDLGGSQKRMNFDKRILLGGFAVMLFLFVAGEGASGQIWEESGGDA